MPSTLKCTQCGGDLTFTPELQLWKCEWCDKEHTQADLHGFTQEADEALNTAAAVTHKCGYCGAEVITAEETAQTFCLYYQRPVTILSQVSGDFKPSFVLPFKYTKDGAMEQFRAFLKGKRFVPDSYCAEKNLEKISGVYIPFWLFDGTVHFSVNGEGDIITTTRQGDYRVTRTDTYRVARAGVLSVKDVPVDASSKTPDDIMDSIEPYDFRELKPFATPYLSGFLAERYDVERNDAFTRAKRRMESSAEKKIKDSLTRYSRVRRQQDHKNTEDKAARYGLLPVWMLHSFFKEKDYLFAMNGQSGKMLGNLPMDGGKMVRFALLVFLGGGVGSALLGFALRYFGML